jgi:hypothetical protein
MKNLLRSSIAIGLLMGTVMATAPANAVANEIAPANVRPGINLITNPSHEYPGAFFMGLGEVNVSWNWVPFWEDAPEGTNPRDPYYRRPEFRPTVARDYPYRVHSGGASNRWFNFYALNKKAGVMQYVENVPVGSALRFTSWVQLWSSEDDDPAVPPRSTRDGNLQVRVCVDQDGGPRNMDDPELKCGDWSQPYDKWAQISVDAVAKNSVVNVMIWSAAAVPVKHNDTYADDSCFEILTSAADKGICLGASYVPTGEGLTGPSQDAASVKPGTATTTTTSASPTAVPAATAIVAPAGDSPALAVNARNGVNVRARPATNGKVLGAARRGQVLAVTGKSANGLWYQVTFKGGTGWVIASLSKPNAAAQAAAVVP